MTASGGALGVERVGHGVVLTLDRKETHNALDEALSEALVGAVRDAEADTSLRGIVLTGAGSRTFSSGGDLRMLAQIAHDPERGRDVSAMGEALSILERASVPVVAAVQGDAFGGGCELLLLADVVIVESHARLGFRHARMGLSPAWGGLTRLLERVGPQAASRALFTAESIDAAEAVRMGLAMEVVPSGASRDRALALVDRFAENGRESVTALKQTLLAVRTELRGRALGIERAAFEARWSGPDHRAAMLAFTSRR